MRDLSTFETTQVSGATGCYTPPVCAPTPPVCAPIKKKGNNGFGNGPNDGVPGQSSKTGKTDTNR